MVFFLVVILGVVTVQFPDLMRKRTISLETFSTDLAELLMGEP
jgi:hypothetical protein